MKTQLLFLSCFAFCATILAQQNIWTGTVDDKWSNKENWTGEVPAASDDVLIPSGFTVTIDTPVNILSIEVQGNSVLNVTESLIIANPSEFEDNVVVNWSGGDLSGGGILLNSGTINMSFPSFDLSGSTSLNNPGTINLVAGGVIFINPNSVINNSGTGIIDFKANGTAITKAGGAPNSLINDGLIKTSFPNDSDSASIAAALINRDGVLQVEKGSLNLNNTLVNLEGATFNISNGAALNLNSPMTVSGTLKGNVLGNLNWNDDMSVAGTAIFNFSGNNAINWMSGDLTGGGVLTNNTIINRNSGGNTAITGSTTLDNNNEIWLSGGGDILIGADCTLNNNMSSIIDFRSDNGNISSLGFVDDTRVLNNLGLIKVNLPDIANQGLIGIKLNNNNGTIEVNKGGLLLAYEGITLTNGSYNIGSTGNLGWVQPITISGNLSGSLQGNLLWEADLLVPSSASFNFTGTGAINWNKGHLEGGGVLNNEHLIIKSSGGTKRINSGSTLNNNGEIRQTVGGAILIATNSVLNNNVNGVIDLQASTAGFGSTGSAPNTINNFGIIKGNASTGSASLAVDVINNGTIEILQNTLTFSKKLTNENTGTIKGISTINVPSSPDFTNKGTFAPGASPGVLNVTGNYTSTPSNILDIELNGPNQGSQYDLLAINGNASFDGSLQISLNFEPALNDEFIVATTSGTISNCNLPASQTVNYNGFQYEFNITCRNNDELVLTLSKKTLGIDLLKNDISKVKLYPNPAKYSITFSDNRIIKIRIFDANGRQVLSTQGLRASVKNLSKGIYFVQGITADNITVVKKLIKI
ncbi:T9SS type A sorting domain-containing protein [Cognatitamlana onchidii]|uniref:T9SS type A sorting domain-containing protein n=1 Tax=Cognatitamlana onchidii TaxID=2562860 RepID=UPI0010A60070|nr:T9SS type A sorting domain-containing protein [Algibacter onchidii]